MRISGSVHWDNFLSISLIFIRVLLIFDMNVLELHSFYKRKIDFLLPNSCKIVKNLGKRKILPPISPKESTMIIKSPGVFAKLSRKSKKNSKDEENRTLQRLFESSIKKFAFNKQVVHRNAKTPTPCSESFIGKKIGLKEKDLAGENSNRRIKKIVVVNAKSFQIKNKLSRKICVPLFIRVQSNSPVLKNKSIVTE